MHVCIYRNASCCNVARSWWDNPTQYYFGISVLSLWLQLASLLLFIQSAIFFRRQSQLTIISIPHKALLILQCHTFCIFLCILPCCHICDYNLQNWQLRSSPWFMGSSICTQLTAGEYRPAYFCPAVDTKWIKVLKVDNIESVNRQSDLKFVKRFTGPKISG